MSDQTAQGPRERLADLERRYYGTRDASETNALCGSLLLFAKDLVRGVGVGVPTEPSGRAVDEASLGLTNSLAFALKVVDEHRSPCSCRTCIAARMLANDAFRWLRAHGSPRAGGVSAPGSNTGEHTDP